MLEFIASVASKLDNKLRTKNTKNRKSYLKKTILFPLTTAIAKIITAKKSKGFNAPYIGRKNVKFIPNIVSSTLNNPDQHFV